MSGASRHPLAEQCTATAKGSGERCQLRVIGGGPCRLHGGKAPQVAAARERRIIAGEAALAAAGAVARSPHDALLAAAGDADAILQRLKQEITSGRLDDRTLLQVLGEWVDRAARVNKLVIDARIDERKVELAEGQAAIVVAAFRAAIEVAGSELLPLTRDAMTRTFLASLGPSEPAGDVVVGELG